MIGEASGDTISVGNLDRVACRYCRALKGLEYQKAVESSLCTTDRNGIGEQWCDREEAGDEIQQTLTPAI